LPVVVEDAGLPVGVGPTVVAPAVGSGAAGASSGSNTAMVRLSDGGEADGLSGVSDNAVACRLPNEIAAMAAKPVAAAVPAAAQTTNRPDDSSRSFTASSSVVLGAVPAGTDVRNSR
jgi:hypothetical protein